MQQQDEEKHGPLPEIEKLKVYKIRWFILAIFVLYSTSNAMQWIQYSIIANVIVKYYGVSTTWVDWTSMLYMILYIPFIFPGSYLLDKLGLRVAVLIGMVGTCAGAWIKVGSVSPDRFWVGFLGQAVVALSQVFVLSVPARLAAVWFGPSQVSYACRIGVFGNQLGVALGFLIPPMIVSGSGNEEQIAKDLYILFIAVGIYTSALLIIIIFFFKDEPPTPPSYAQTQPSENQESMSFLQSLKRLMLNRSYVLLLISYGINTGIFYAISTLLNQIILLYYPDSEEDAGRIGLVIVVAGMFGSVACGVILDRFHKFKETTLAVYALSLVGMVVYTFTLNEGIAVVYFTSALLGFFMTGLLPVGFEFGAELTYPEPEGTSAGLLNASAQVFGIAFTNIYSVIFNNLNDIWANSIMSVMLLVGTIMTGLIKSDLRRQAAHSNK
jgi:FLVCR family feline leukemia virus subgroup C receptor-related protein